MAISIGTRIEQTEGEGTQAVAFLEQYCESVYQASVALQKEIIGNAKKYLKEMTFCLDSVIERIDNEF